MLNKGKERVRAGEAAHLEQFCERCYTLTNLIKFMSSSSYLCLVIARGQQRLLLFILDNLYQ